MNEDIKNSMMKHETLINEYGTQSSESIRLFPSKNDIRTSFFRDTDKIIHALSYTRYIDKTQVFTNSDNDNVTKRIIHVQLVAKIARTIGRALSLNEDLIEAIALGHDIGHVPFGHPGESILNEISLKYTGTHFFHNVQGVREFMNLENNGKGINLSIQVLDGILCHNGEFVLGKYIPIKKTVKDFLSDYEKCYKDEKYIKKLRPMTLEGCVVRISDMIAYLGRDIEDAIKLNVIKENQIPSNIINILGKTNKSIVNTIINDIIKNSFNKPYIKLSNDVYNAIKNLKKFNYEFIYTKANNVETLNYYNDIFNKLFIYYLENIDNPKCSINYVYLNGMDKNYLNNTTNERKIIDYLAGMTDDYIIKEYNKMNELKNRRFEVVKEYKNKGINLPERKTKYSAAYDVEAAEDITIPVYKPGIKPTLIPTGLKAFCQKDEFYMLINRSSGPKKGLFMPHGVGIIDSDYYDNNTNEGHFYFQYINMSDKEINIKKGDVIGQVIFQKYLITDDDNAQGERFGGFGSTDSIDN